MEGPNRPYPPRAYKLVKDTEEREVPREHLDRMRGVQRRSSVSFISRDTFQKNHLS